MRQTAREILDKHRIIANALREGNQVTRCPECSHTRKKKRVPCLSIKIDAAGVQYLCHHCGWHGGEYFETGRDYHTEFNTPKRAERRKFGVERAYR